MFSPSAFAIAVAYIGGKVIEDDRLSEVAAVVLFIIGSVVLTVGAMIDYLVVVRAPRSKPPTEKSPLAGGARSRV